MEENTDIQHEVRRLRLLAAVLDLQHYTRAAANIVPIPGGDRVIAIGTPAQVRALLPNVEVKDVPDGFVIAPHFRGYAHLGIGAYVLNHSAAGEVSELAISIATEAQKAGRKVGDLQDNEPDEMVQPEDIAVRLRFENVAGLDALEQQLRFVRTVHFPESVAQWASTDDRLPLGKAARDVLGERRRQIEAEGMTNDGDDRYHAAELPRAAASYILNGANDEAPYIWPWAKSWWKPRDTRANYVRAAALLLAEIERIDRAQEGGHHD